MNPLEELMAGLFGSLNAPAAEDDRRRRGGAGHGATGYEGIGGAAALPGMMLPFLTGTRNYDYSGPMGQDFQGGGLASLLAHLPGDAGFQSPALRHFQNQGFDVLPPGLNDQNQLGGPNVAPGNIDSGQALNQPMGNPTPGVPQGVGLQTAPGQVGPAPQTQGWRNYAPGYAAAASLGYGTPEFGSHFAPGLSLPPASVGGSQSTGGGGGTSQGVGPQAPQGPQGLVDLVPGGGPGQATAGIRNPVSAPAGGGRPNQGPGNGGPGPTPHQQAADNQNPSAGPTLAEQVTGANVVNAPANAPTNMRQMTGEGRRTQGTRGQGGGGNQQQVADNGVVRHPHESYSDWRARVKARDEWLATKAANAQARKDAAAAAARASSSESHNAGTSNSSEGTTTLGSGRTVFSQPQRGQVKKSGGANTTTLGSGRTVFS